MVFRLLQIIARAVAGPVEPDTLSLWMDLFSLDSVIWIIVICNCLLFLYSKSIFRWHISWQVLKIAFGSLQILWRRILPRTTCTAVKRLNRYFCFLLLGFHLPVTEKWAKMYKSVSQLNYLSIFLKILSFFRWKRFALKEESCLKMAPIITSASVFNHLELFK